MQKITFKFLMCLVVIYSILILTACPKADRTVRQLKEKSAELSIYGTKLIKAFGDAYRAGEITQDELKKLNEVTGAFVRGVGVYRQALAEAERVARENSDMTSIKLKDLEKLLDDQVVATFFDILAGVGLMSVSQSDIIKTILSGIRLTILALQSAFSDARFQLQRFRPQGVIYGTAT